MRQISEHFTKIIIPGSPCANLFKSLKDLGNHGTAISWAFVPRKCLIASLFPILWIRYPFSSHLWWIFSDPSENQHRKLKQKSNFFSPGGRYQRFSRTSIFMKCTMTNSQTGITTLTIWSGIRRRGALGAKPLQGMSTWERLAHKKAGFYRLNSRVTIFIY